jgi:hypothetical protein
MTLIHNCDSLVGWSFIAATGTIESGQLKVTATGDWNAFADLNQAVNLLNQKLKFRFKTDDATPSILKIQLICQSWNDTVTMDFANQSDVVLDPSTGTKTGSPDLARIQLVRFVFQNRGRQFNYYLNDIESVTDVVPPVTIYPDLPLVAESNFAAGIAPFAYSGSGSYALIPNGVKVWNSPTAMSRGSLIYEAGQIAGEAMIETMLSFDKFEVGAVLMPYQAQVAASAEFYFYQDRWILNYFDGAGEKRTDITNVNELNRKYKVVVYVKFGAGTGQIRIWIDDVEKVSLNGLNNIAMATNKTFEVGNFWGAAGTNEIIDYIKLSAVPQTAISLSGRILDSLTLQGVPYAGIRFGFGDSYVKGVIADGNGNYALSLPEATYSTVKIIKRGYGNLSDPTGVSIFHDVAVSPMTPTIDFGIGPQALLLPSGAASTIKAWNFRGVTLFPWTFGSYNSPEYAACLDEIKQTMPHCNGIEIRLYLLGKIDGSVVQSDAWGNEGNASNYIQDTMFGIDEAHTKGFKVFVGIVLLVESGFTMNNAAAFFSDHEQRIAEYCVFLEMKNVEYISLTFEPRLNMFKHDAELQTLFSTCRTKTSAKLGFHHNQLAYAPNDALAGSWWLDADFVFGFGWWRMTYKSDPSHQELLNAWNAPPDWSYSSDNDPAWSQGTSKTYPNPMSYAKAYQKSVSPRLLHDILVIVNTGIPAEDYANMNPWSSGSEVYDLDEQALYYKTFFEAWREVPNMLGLDAERHGDKHDDSTLRGTSSVRGRPAELFIEEGYTAASETVTPPPPPPPTPSFAARSIGPLGVPAAVVHQLWRLREHFIRPEVHRKLHPLV